MRERKSQNITRAPAVLRAQLGLPTHEPTARPTARPSATPLTFILNQLLCILRQIGVT